VISAIAGMGLDARRSRLGFNLPSPVVGSILTPVQVISSEPLHRVAGSMIHDVESEEPLHSVIGEILPDADSAAPTEAVTGELPPESVESELPPEETTSDEPG